MKRVKRRIFEIIEVSASGDLPGRVFNFFIMSLIFVNVIVVIVETEESIAREYPGFFNTFEYFSVAVFSAEYLLRLWTCTENPKYAHPFSGRLRYVFSFMAMVDITAILPFYLPMLIRLDLRFVRALRLLRLIRVLKLGRYSSALQMLGRVVRTKKEEIFITAFILIMLLVIASGLMYYIEKDAQPKQFSSIPSAMWWGVATLTTVGYGDVYPITAAGKILSAVIAILGIGLFALPTGILASGFIEEMHQGKKERIICPHCGKLIDNTEESRPGEK